ncbi:MAG: class D sortase [Clostridiales bacterium]|nr:class D sortase [Clostridiales bacterium]
MKHSSKIVSGIVIGWIACVSLLLGNTLTHHISHEENEKDRESQMQDMASEIASGGNPTFLVHADDLPVEGEEEEDAEDTGKDPLTDPSDSSSDHASPFSSHGNPSESPSGPSEDPSDPYSGTEATASNDPSSEDTEEETAAGTSRESRTPTTSSSSGSEEYTLISYGRLLIPSIDCELPLWDGAGKIELRYGVGRMPLSCEAGEKGNLVIFGHRMKKKGSIFNRLDEVSYGDAVIVNRDGRSFTYIVDQIEVIEPSLLSRYIAMGEGEKRITLITCTPTGVGSHRLLVIGHLSSS